MSQERAEGERSVAIGGDANYATIVTGDGAQITVVQPPPAPEAPPRLTRATWRQWVGHYLRPKIVASAFAAVVALLSGLVGLYQWAAPFIAPAPVMPGRLNVAVAQFSALEPSGKPLDMAQAINVGAPVQAVLARQLTDSGSGEIRPDVEVWSPTRTGPIPGNSEAERDRNVVQFAERLHADVVVFGQITTSPRGTLVNPRFYLAPRKLGDAEELVGVHALGLPIRADGEVTTNGTSTAVSAALLKRSSALGQLLLGLDYLQANQFGEAREYLADAASNWEGDGGALVYLFLGNAAGRLGDLRAAEGYYNESLKKDASYPRARFGLAEVLYQESGATLDCDPSKVQLDGLRGAIAQFETVAAQLTSGLSNLSTKTQLALGSAYTCYSQAQDADDRWDAARGAFRRVIADHAGRTGSAQEQIRDFAAEAHAGLGFTYLPFSSDPPGETRDAAYRAAAAEYQQGVELSDHGDRRAVFYRFLSFIHARLGQIDHADADLRAAASEDPQNAASYEEMRRQLRATSASAA